MTDDDADRTPAPSTSIAWRLGHVIVGVLAVRSHSHFGGPPADYMSWDYAATAEEARAQLDREYARGSRARAAGTRRTSRSPPARRRGRGPSTPASPSSPTSTASSSTTSPRWRCCATCGRIGGERPTCGASGSRCAARAHRRSGVDRPGLGKRLPIDSRG